MTRKQTELLVEVPGAVTSISGDTFGRNPLTNLDQIAQVAPQVNLTPGNADDGGSFSIAASGRHDDKRVERIA